MRDRGFIATNLGQGMCQDVIRSPTICCYLLWCNTIGPRADTIRSGQFEKLRLTIGARDLLRVPALQARLLNDYQDYITDLHT